MDESFIYERLKALSGGLEREGYRDISKAFEEVVRYNRQALRELETKLNEELRDISERFYLYGAVAAAGDTPIVNDFLFPMDEGSEPESHARRAGSGSCLASLMSWRFRRTREPSRERRALRRAGATREGSGSCAMCIMRTAFTGGRRICRMWIGSRMSSARSRGPGLKVKFVSSV